MYYCHECGRHVDDDWHPCEQHPNDPLEFICPSCNEEQDMNEEQAYDESLSEGDRKQHEELEGLSKRDHEIKCILRDPLNPKATFVYINEEYLDDHEGRIHDGVFYFDTPYGYRWYHLKEVGTHGLVCMGVGTKPIGYAICTQ